MSLSLEDRYEYGGDLEFWLYLLIPPMMAGMMIPILNKLYLILATKLNNWENHKTESEQSVGKKWLCYRFERGTSSKRSKLQSITRCSLHSHDLLTDSILLKICVNRTPSLFQHVGLWSSSERKRMNLRNVLKWNKIPSFKQSDTFVP